MFKWFNKRTNLTPETVKNIENIIETEKIHEADKMRAIKESATILGNSLSKILLENNRSTLLMMRGIEKNISNTLNNVDKVDANKTVYGFYLVKIFDVTKDFVLGVTQPINLDSMLVLVVASNQSEAEIKKNAVLKKNNHNSNEWQVVLTNHLPIYAEEKRFSDPVVDVPKVNPIETYITNLQYARDRFAKTPHEKGIITKIINSIKNEKHTA